MLRVITRTPTVGEHLTARFYSAGRVEEYRVEVVEVFAAACRVRILGGAMVRVHMVQLLESV